MDNFKLSPRRILLTEDTEIQRGTNIVLLLAYKYLAILDW